VENEVIKLFIIIIIIICINFVPLSCSNFKFSGCLGRLTHM